MQVYEYDGEQRRDLGVVVRYAKSDGPLWVASNVSQHTKMFPRRRDAFAWLLFTAKSGGEHLQRLIQYRDTTYKSLFKRALATRQQDAPDGLYDTLLSFAKGLGYTITPRSFTGDSNLSGALGQINYTEHGIFVNPCQSAWSKVHTLTHELAHHFDLLEHGYTMRNYAEREQIVDAVAYSLLYDYGFVSTDRTVEYVDSYATHPKELSLPWMRSLSDWYYTAFVPTRSLFDRELDNEYQRVYHAMGFAFQEFLKG